MKFSEKEIDEFIAEIKYKSYSNIVDSLLKSGNNALMKQDGWDETEYLHFSIRDCVKAYNRDKDKAICMFRDFVGFLEKNGFEIKKEVEFPPIPIMNSFERLMFIAKYMQDEGHSRSDLPDILWHSQTTIDNDFSRLLNEDNPDSIQVLGKPFVITGSRSHGGKVDFESTAHPLFLTPNLTQVILILEGLKVKAENSIFETEAMITASDIWNQLSDYARSRIRFVLSECLMIEDLAWYESLAHLDDAGNSFHTEKKNTKDRGFIFDCVKNHTVPFCIEYNDNGKTTILKDCTGEKIIKGEEITVRTGSGIHKLRIKDIARVAYTIEELLSEDSCLIHKS